MSDPSKPSYTRSFMVVTSLFFMWGFITVLVDSLVPRLKEVFEIQQGTAGLLQFFFFLAYFVVAFPAGKLLSKVGSQKGMLIGLGIMGIGCLLYWPAAGFRQFGLFLMAMFTLAGGMAILQVAANPYVSVLGSDKGASSRLNLAQAFNSFGTMIAPMAGAKLILSDNILTGDEIKALDDVAKEAYFVAEAASVQMPFVWLAGALLVLAGIVAMANLPKVLEESVDGGYAEAFKIPRLRWGSLAIFLYVGAEVAIGTYAVSYFVDLNLHELIKEHPAFGTYAAGVLGKDLETVDPKGICQVFVAFYWGGAMVGRFIGSALTYFIKPSHVLAAFGLSAIALIGISIASTGLEAMFSLVLIGLFNSIMFPTIFTLAIDGLGKLKAQGSGILVAAILGGGVIPPLYGYMADFASNYTDVSEFKVAFILPLLCYAYILIYALRSKPSTTIN